MRYLLLAARDAVPNTSRFQRCIRCVIKWRHWVYHVAVVPGCDIDCLLARVPNQGTSHKGGIGESDCACSLHVCCRTDLAGESLAIEIPTHHTNMNTNTYVLVES